MLRLNLKKELFKINMTNINYDKFIVYTDGACRNNGKATALSSIGVYFSNHNVLGIVILKVVPLLDESVTSISPSCFANKSLHKDRPTPNPSFFVVNNGSNTLDKNFLSMPCPLSEMSISMPESRRSTKTMIFTGKDVAAWKEFINKLDSICLNNNLSA